MRLDLAELKGREVSEEGGGGQVGGGGATLGAIMNNGRGFLECTGHLRPEGCARGVGDGGLFGGGGGGGGGGCGGQPQRTALHTISISLRTVSVNRILRD